MWAKNFDANKCFVVLAEESFIRKFQMNTYLLSYLYLHPDIKSIYNLSSQNVIHYYKYHGKTASRNGPSAFYAVSSSTTSSRSMNTTFKNCSPSTFVGITTLCGRIKRLIVTRLCRKRMSAHPAIFHQRLSSPNQSSADCITRIAK